MPHITIEQLQQALALAQRHMLLQLQNRNHRLLLTAQGAVAKDDMSSASHQPHDLILQAIRYTRDRHRRGKVVDYLPPRIIRNNSNINVGQQNLIRQILASRNVADIVQRIRGVVPNSRVFLVVSDGTNNNPLGMNARLAAPQPAAGASMASAMPAVTTSTPAVASPTSTPTLAPTLAPAVANATNIAGVVTQAQGIVDITVLTPQPTTPAVNPRPANAARPRLITRQAVNAAQNVRRNRNLSRLSTPITRRIRNRNLIPPMSTSQRQRFEAILTQMVNRLAQTPADANVDATALEAFRNFMTGGH